MLGSKRDISAAQDPISMLPDCFRTPETMQKLDQIIDIAAANSRWSNTDVARAVCRLLHLIVGDMHAPVAANRVKNR